MNERFDGSLRQALFDDTVAPLGDEDRARTISFIVATARRERRVRNLRAATFTFAVAAILAGLFVALRGPPVRATAPAVAAAALQGDAFRVRRVERTRLLGKTALAAGDAVVVGTDGEAGLELDQGTRLHLFGRDARLVLVSPAPEMRFELTGGTVAARVHPLSPGQRFVLRVDDVEVEVHGTAFEVERTGPMPSCGGATVRVRVREGVVGVRRGGASEVFVRPGERWPAECPEVVAEGTPPASEGKLAATGPTPTASPLAIPSTVPRDAPTASALLVPKQASTSVASASRASGSRASTDLALQNDLFERATTRRREGDIAGAVAAFDELVARFPSSHLAHNARVERMRLLQSFDRDRARAAARDYLQHHPGGFARADAEILLRE